MTREAYSSTHEWVQHVSYSLDGVVEHRHDGAKWSAVKVLAISDKIIKHIYSPAVRDCFGHVDAVISCGDLPYYYVEYVVSALDKPVFFVRGNHASLIEHGVSGPRTSPWGAMDLDCQVIEHEDLLLAGFQGSIRYNEGPFQYTDQEMIWRIGRTLPRLFLNRAIHGRYLDVLVTHSPPRDVQDQSDPCHRGFKAFRWYLEWFQPAYMLHGHIHIYHPSIVTRTRYRRTDVINCYGYRVLDLYPTGRAPRALQKENDHDRSTSARRLRQSDPKGVLESDQKLADGPE